MRKTCNLSTVKNTQREALQCVRRADFYYIDAYRNDDSDDSMQYDTIETMLDVIYDALEYSDLSFLDGTVVYAYYDNNTRKPLFMFKNDVVEHSFRVVRYNN